MGVDLKKCEAYQKLPQKRKMFVLEYIKDSNGTQAAIRAGYSKKTANEQASELLAIPSVKAAVQEVFSQLNELPSVATIKELREFWTSILRGNITDVASFNENGMSFTADSETMDPQVSRLIKKIRVTERVSQKGDIQEVRTDLELHDPLKASELLGQTYGIFKEKVEHSGIVQYVPQIIDYSTARKK